MPRYDITLNLTWNGSIEAPTREQAEEAAKKFVEERLKSGGKPK